MDEPDSRSRGINGFKGKNTYSVLRNTSIAPNPIRVTDIKFYFGRLSLLVAVMQSTNFSKKVTSPFFAGNSYNR